MGNNLNIKVGKPDTSPSLPSHTPGIRAGNDIGNLEREPGFVSENKETRATPRRSTGIGAEHRKPIDPRMPVLTPA